MTGKQQIPGRMDPMKVLQIGKKGNIKKYSAADSFLLQMEAVEMYMTSDIGAYLEAAGDADFIVCDAVAEIPAKLIEQMPHLKMIHSEGVAYNQIDTGAAARRGIYVCNSQGMNASAVAEQTILLMLGMLRDVCGGDRAVREGRQIDVKEGHIINGDLKELADCAVGLVGFGNIARETARLLRAFGVKEIYYNKKIPLSEQEAAQYGVKRLTLPDLLAASDIVSLHMPLNAATEKIADSSFFAAMKDGSYFVNTARGGLVDDEALIESLMSGKLAMAGLDTINDEPVQTNHPLLQCPEQVRNKILFSPHIGGVTGSSLHRSYAMIAEDIQAVAEGRRPERIVNGL